MTSLMMTNRSHLDLGDDHSLEGLDDNDDSPDGLMTTLRVQRGLGHVAAGAERPYT